MSRMLIGQVLSRMGKLSTIDIDEILAEQALTQRPFGQIALSWGLCDLEQLCDAWCRQLSDPAEQPDLEHLCPDPQVLPLLPADLARSIGTIPLRSIGNELVVAAGRDLEHNEILRLSHASGLEVRVIRADAEQVRRLIERSYAPSC